MQGLVDLELSERLLAEQEPWWPPGQGSGYHMVCYGHLLDGLVRAATGVPLADQFRALVAEPRTLGLEADDLRRPVGHPRVGDDGRGLVATGVVDRRGRSEPRHGHG